MNREHTPVLSLVTASWVAAVASACSAVIVLMLLSGPAIFLTLAFSPVIFALAVLFATLHATLLGVPLALLVERRWQVNGWNASIAGLIIGGMPTALWLGPTLLDANDGSYGFARIIGFCAAMGGFGGLVFYLKLAGKLARYGL